MSEAASGVKRRALGRGLGALIPQGAPLAPPVERRVPIAEIRPNPRQPRRVFDENRLAELAKSIHHQGMLQPLVVRQVDQGYELIIGERRLRAAQRAGLERVSVVIKEVSDAESLEMALVENIQRRDLNPLEEAHAFRQLIDEHGLTQEKLGQRIGKSRVAVTNTLRLLQLPEPVREALASGSITEGHARAILMANGETQRLLLLERVLADHLSVRDTEALAREMNAPSARTHAAEAVTDPDVERLEDAFRQALGTRVRLLKGRRGGRLVIHFFSDDELQGIYEAIVRS